MIARLVLVSAIFFLTGFSGCSGKVGTSPAVSPTAPAADGLPTPITGQRYVLTFSDEFQSLSSIDASSVFSGAKWYNGVKQCCMGDTTGGLPAVNYPTAVGGTSVNPYSLLPQGGLAITLSKNTTANAWFSGVLSSVDSNFTGFSQQYGYFEMKAQFPVGDGTWPAFWMLSTNASLPGEIDIVEAYGHDLGTKFISTLHDWRNGGNNSNITETSSIINVGSTTDGYHTYGLLWTASDLIFYFDGAEVWRHETPEVMHQPYSLLANLGLGGGWPTGATPTTNQMNIAYIRAYQQLPPTLPTSARHQTFVFAGRDQLFVVPSGVTQFTVKAWGAGGGGGHTDGYGYFGGSGGYTTATVNVTSSVYTVSVGGPGSRGSMHPTFGSGGAAGGNGGSGGGRSALLLNGVDLIVAAGGGGGGYGGTSEVGGNGGGATGGSSGTTYSGLGATASAGGVGGNISGPSSATGSTGSARSAGAGCSDGGYCGGGGGGYFGGGGGASGSGLAGGGGGGSSYFGGAHVSGGSTLAGSGATAPNTSDAAYISGVAVGGDTSSSTSGAGGNGLVEISW